MEESNLSNDGSTLNVTLSSNWDADNGLWGELVGTSYSRNDRISKSYKIGKVKFHMRFVYKTTPIINSEGYVIRNHNSNIYLIRFSQPNSDQNSYNIIFASPTFAVRRKLKTDDIWLLIAEQDNANGKFEITVEIEVEIKLSQFSSLHDDEELTDFELRGDDGAVTVHRAVLASYSPAFKAMLTKNWKESQDRFLQIRNVSKATLQHLKDYMYLDKLPRAGVEQLLLIASCYMMEDLESRCKMVLIHKLSARNSTDLFTFALTNNMKDLYIAFLKRIKDGFVKIEDIEYCTLE